MGGAGLLVQSRRYNITLAMFDLMTHERALPQPAQADAGPGPQEPRLSALGASARARLIVAASLLAALWAGAYWALH